jgi:hypothetical protein
MFVIKNIKTGFYFDRYVKTNVPIWTILEHPHYFRDKQKAELIQKRLVTQYEPHQKIIIEEVLNIKYASVNEASNKSL